METNTPDLTHFYAIHRKMRIDMRLYVRALETATADDRFGRLTALAKWVRGFVLELSEHHHVEDTIFFPSVRNRVPSVGDVLDTLDGDHKIVHDLLERWPEAAGRLAHSRIPFEAARAEALEIGRTLRDLLERHLAIEDTIILPAFSSLYSVEEYGELTQGAIKNGKKRGVTFFVPWNVAAMPPEHVHLLMDEAPAALKLVWRLTRGRFARLEEQAFGGIHVDISDLESECASV
jgi:hemerythrin-like domain-containing protein